MPKPTCVESTAVKVSVDELMTELLRRMPLESLTEALLSATMGARKRLGTKRHNRYKSEKFFRRAVERLPEIPPYLAAAVGMKTSEPLSCPDIAVDPPVPAAVEPATEPVYTCEKHMMGSSTWPCSDCPPAVALLQTANQPAQMVTADPTESEPDEIEDEPTPPPASQDEFAELLDIPRFEDYETVFASYPYAWEMIAKSGERRLVLGYASARNRDSDNLVRRNCSYTGADGNSSSFNDLPSVVGLLKSEANGVRRLLKVLPYHPGAKVRFWTNVAGKGDREDLYRYVLITEDGLERVHSRVAFDQA